MSADDLLTAEQLADRLQLRPETVLIWFRRGRIPGRRLTPKVIRFALGDVLAALDARRREEPGTPPPTDPTDAGPTRNDLITEVEVREVLEPQVVDELIGHLRHHHAPDGTRYWARSECQDLLGAIESREGVRL